MREQALRELEGLRNSKTIKANLEARVVIHASGDDYTRLARYADKLAAFLVVSQVKLHRGEDGSALACEADRAQGTKCERCWNFSTRVGEDAAYPTVCERCSASLAIIEGERASSAAGNDPS